MFCGKEKIPPPTIDPTTSAISAPSLSLFDDADADADAGADPSTGVDFGTDMTHLLQVRASSSARCTSSLSVK
jgi:hypothetical protein